MLHNLDKVPLLISCKLTVYDEATMSHKGSLEALHATRKDLLTRNDVLEGATLLAGYFRQIPPVIPKGSLVDEENACPKRSSIKHTITFTDWPAKYILFRSNC